MTVAMTTGAVLPPVSVRLTRESLVRYAGASGDFNPIHYSDRAASDLGLPGVLAHGMLTMGSALKVVTDWVGDPAAIMRYSVRFTKPVVVPDDGIGAELLVSGTILSVDQGVATIGLEATCNGERVLGQAKVEVAA